VKGTASPIVCPHTAKKNKEINGTQCKGFGQGDWETGEWGGVITDPNQQ